jgi:hypothetical protein
VQDNAASDRIDSVSLVNNHMDLDTHWTVYWSYNTWIEVCRRNIVNWILLFDTTITIITSGEYGCKFKDQQYTLGDMANTPNSSEICISSLFHLEAFWRPIYTHQDIMVCC